MFKTNFDAVFYFYFNFTFSLEWNLQKKKCRKIVLPKLVTSVCFQKGLNPQIVKNKEIHRNLKKKKKKRVKLMWVFGFYKWYISLTTKLSEFMKWNMVILKTCDFLKTLKSGFRPFWKQTLQILDGVTCMMRTVLYSKNNFLFIYLFIFWKQLQTRMPMNWCYNSKNCITRHHLSNVRLYIPIHNCMQTYSILNEHIWIQSNHPIFTINLIVGGLSPHH